MSPTSYQAAPPRTTTIADARALVKSRLRNTSFQQALSLVTKYCKVCRPAPLLRYWNVHPSYRSYFGPDSEPHCRTPEPSPPGSSSDQRESNADISPAAYHPEIVAQLVYLACSCRLLCAIPADRPAAPP